MSPGQITDIKKNKEGEIVASLPDNKEYTKPIPADQFKKFALKSKDLSSEEVKSKYANHNSIIFF